MKRYIFSQEASDDLVAIFKYIAKRDSAAAKRLKAMLIRACEELALNAELGHSRRDLTEDPDVKFYRVHNAYLVVFRKGSNPLEIIRIFHGAQDVGSLLQQ